MKVRLYPEQSGNPERADFSEIREIFDFSTLQRKETTYNGRVEWQVKQKIFDFSTLQRKETTYNGRVSDKVEFGRVTQELYG